MPAGRVGRPHGRDGSFYVESPGHALEAGTEVTVAGRVRRIARRAGTADRPLLRLDGTGTREEAAALRGERLLLPESEALLAEGEWLASDLAGCEVPGLGTVRRVVPAPSCDLLEVGDEGVLVPFVSDAIRRVDVAAGVIEADLAFLALDEEPVDEGGG